MISHETNGTDGQLRRRLYGRGVLWSPSKVKVEQSLIFALAVLYGNNPEATT